MMNSYMLYSYEINKGLRIARQLLLDLVSEQKKITSGNRTNTHYRMKWVFLLVVNSWIP
jgi:phospho-2-dehydro-3-deoxyheptonate aldolase